MNVSLFGPLLEQSPALLNGAACCRIGPGDRPPRRNRVKRSEREQIQMHIQKKKQKKNRFFSLAFLSLLCLRLLERFLAARPSRLHPPTPDESASAAVTQNGKGKATPRTGRTPMWSPVPPIGGRKPEGEGTAGQAGRCRRLTLHSGAECTGLCTDGFIQSDEIMYTHIRNV